MSFGEVSEQEARKEENDHGVYQILDLCYCQKLVPIFNVPAESSANSALEGCLILGSNGTQTVSSQNYMFYSI